MKVRNIKLRRYERAKQITRKYFKVKCTEYDEDCYCCLAYRFLFVYRTSPIRSDRFAS
jgi:hypothetical protein